MAVQKSKKSPSRRGMRRSHDRVEAATLSEDRVSGQVHRRHHLTKWGYYRGRHIVDHSGKGAEESE